MSIYPKFAYNASSGGGTGTVQQLGDNKLQITFDTDGEAPSMCPCAYEWLAHHAAVGHEVVVCERVRRASATALHEVNVKS